MIETDGGQLFGSNVGELFVSVASSILTSTEITGFDGADMFILATEKSNQTSGFTFNVIVKDFSHSQGDKIDTSDLRDATGNIIDLQDILDHASVSGGNTIIDLGTFTSGGRGVSGTLTLENISSPAGLSASDFVFSGGVDWAAQLPVDVSLYG